MFCVVGEQFSNGVSACGRMSIKQGIYARYVKRVLDFSLSLLILLVFWWVLVIVAILVRVKLGSPVIFKQPRPGKDGRIFDIYKFRTMTDERDEHGNLLPDLQRLTPFGRKLRDFSIDELPEILNVVRGDMALVGPRPLLVEYLELYDDRQRHRHDVRPGITGFAQTHGRNAATWEDRFEMDVSYVERISFPLDLRILVDTVLVVVSRKDVDSAEASARTITMDTFKGSNRE